MKGYLIVFFNLMQIILSKLIKSNLDNYSQNAQTTAKLRYKKPEAAFYYLLRLL